MREEMRGGRIGAIIGERISEGHTLIYQFLFFSCDVCVCSRPSHNAVFMGSL